MFAKSMMLVYIYNIYVHMYPNDPNDPILYLFAQSWWHKKKHQKIADV